MKGLFLAPEFLSETEPSRRGCVLSRNYLFGVFGPELIERFLIVGHFHELSATEDGNGGIMVFNGVMAI